MLLTTASTFPEKQLMCRFRFEDPQAGPAAPQKRPQMDTLPSSGGTEQKGKKRHRKPSTLSHRLVSVRRVVSMEWMRSCLMTLSRAKEVTRTRTTRLGPRRLAFTPPDDPIPTGIPLFILILLQARGGVYETMSPRVASHILSLQTGLQAAAVRVLPFDHPVVVVGGLEFRPPTGLDLNILRVLEADLERALNDFTLSRLDRVGGVMAASWFEAINSAQHAIHHLIDCCYQLGLGIAPFSPRGRQVPADDDVLLTVRFARSLILT